MAGANIFVIYSDGNGNVTLSPRHGEGEFEPEHDNTANVTLLEGSGIHKGKMVANVLCSNCHRWNGGSTDFSSSAGDWIHASRPGDPLDSADVDEEIEQHDDHGAFTWAYTSAQGGQDVNPFVSTSHSTGVSETPPTFSGSNDSATDDDDDMDNDEASDVMLKAHGTLASIVFLVLFPLGAMIVRIPGLNLPLWVHAGVQIFTYCCYIAAAGLGIFIAKTEHLLNNHHPIIGLVLLAILFFQPFFGVAHHSEYKKKQRRTVISHLHIWIGRLAIILGVVNGGLGFKLVGDVKDGYKIAYGVVAGIIGLAYLTVIVFGEAKRKKEPVAQRQTHDKEAR